MLSDLLFGGFGVPDLIVVRIISIAVALRVMAVCQHVVWAVHW